MRWGRSRYTKAICQRAIAAFERAVKLNPDERAYRLNLEAAREEARRSA